MIIQKLFMEGNMLFMTLLTVEFAALMLVAWKAPAWVKEIGLMAVLTSVIFTCLSLRQIFDFIQQAGGVEMSVFCGGLKVALIPIIYGCLIYFVSLVLRIIQKPRI